MDYMIIKLSRNEQRIYDMLPNGGGQITTRDLVKKFYRGQKVPFNGQMIVSGIVRNLEKKTKGNAIRVKRSYRSGPHPISVWKEKA